jgi:hypothetical protein
MQIEIDSQIEDPALIERRRAQLVVVAVRTYCETVGDNVDATTLAYRETKSLARDRQKVLMRLELSTNEIISNCLHECIEADLMRAVNLDLAAYRIVLLAHGWALKAWHFRTTTTLEEYVKEGLDLFLHALLTPAGWQRWRSLGSELTAGSQ